MRSLKITICFSALCLAVLITVTASAQSPVVKINTGYIRGVTENGIAVFKGIPYAQPPVGELRYLPPVEHAAWTDTLNTTAFGAIAAQPFGDKPAGSEDCLTLNLYTPGIDNHKRAVVIWVHGGSMTNGSGKGMDGHAFADKDDIVTITINYRLGALGFLYLGDVDKKYAQSGNLGLLDVIAALKWIHQNISDFGGNPNRVTVMGESAGAKLLAAVMVSPASKGLYSQAILESGSVQCIRDSITAKNERTRLLKQLGLRPNDAAKLLTLPADSIIKAQGKICEGIGGNSQFGPVYDKMTFNYDNYVPGDAYRYAAKISGVRVLIGTNENEGAAFTNEKEDFRHPDQKIFYPLFGEGNHWFVNEAYKNQLKTDSPYAAMVKILTQYMYQMHSYRLAKVLSNNNTPVWMYRYKYQNGKIFGARHGDELHYIWGAAKILNSSADTAQKQLAQNMHGAWVAFIKTGNPNISTLPQWPNYKNGAHYVMIFDNVDKVIPLPEIYNDKYFPSAVYKTHIDVDPEPVQVPPTQNE